MLPPIVQHVDQGIPHFARRPQHARMIPIAPYAASPPEDAVDGLCDPNREPANTALERRWRLRLYQQVQMVAPNAELEDPESLRARSPQGDLDRREQALLSQARQPGYRTQRHMGRTATIVRDAATVRNAAAPGRGLSSGAAPATAPSSQGELELSCGSHLIWQISIISSNDDQDVDPARGDDAARGIAEIRGQRSLRTVASLRWPVQSASRRSPDAAAATRRFHPPIVTATRPSGPKSATKRSPGWTGIGRMSVPRMTQSPVSRHSP